MMGNDVGIVDVVGTITTTGSAGSASGGITLPAVQGFLLGFVFNYHASAPASTDITITTDDGLTILTHSNVNGDCFVPVRVQNEDNASAVISGSYEPFPLNGPLHIAVAQCDALTGAVVVKARIFKA